MSQKISVGYLGVPGSYSHSAAVLKYPSSRHVGFATFQEIFKAVQSNKILVGVVPIENTLAGSIYENYDNLENNNLSIIGETYLKVEHNLLASKKTALAYKENPQALQIIYSHPKAIEQCDEFLKKLSWVDIESYSDTATAAKYVSEHADLPMASISSLAARDIYGLYSIAENIESNAANYTRFLAIARNKNEITSKLNKCTLMMYLKHEEGALYRTLGILRDNKCNVMKIESRPLVGKPFEYVFYFDFIYDQKMHDIEQILNDLKSVVVDVQLLGIYRSDSFNK